MNLIEYIKNKKAALEMDQLGKLLIGLALLIVLIVIVTVYVGGEFSNQSDKVSSVFKVF